ncbi:MAG: hypothetical protein DRP64_04110 [Verrucomicrobia bacterium]|nr:MAG: hypothetical protein DRP64_04110 [Verrucomicrobiota bacterium]
MKRPLSICFLILFFAVSVQAAYIGQDFWTGAANADYHNAANWSLGVVAANGGGSEYDLFLDIAGSGPVVTADTQVNVAHFGGATWSSPPGGPANINFTINSGNFSTIWWFVVGEQFGSSGTINMNGGSLTVGTDLMIGAHQGGSGILNMNGGVINTYNLFYAFDGGGDLSQQFGHINLSGGIINITGSLVTNDRGWIDITGNGQLNIAGDWVESIRTNQVAWGHIRAHGGFGKVVANYNSTSGMTEITAADASLFSNPLATPPTGADPFVLEYEGVYYLYCTAENHLTDTGIPVYTSTNLVDWTGPAGAGPSGLALHKDDVWGDKWFWGGDVIEKDGMFYMYATANEHLIAAVSDSPLGPFTQAVQQPMHGINEIDASVFSDDDGKHYIYFVRFDAGNVEYVAELSDDMLSMKEETITFCLRAQWGTWERGPNEPQASVLEGAYAVKHNGLYYLIYTANHFMSIDYSMGYATSTSPFGPWTRYSGNPILQTTASVHGPGNGMVVHSPDGSEMFLCYHVHYDLNNVWPRRVALDRIWFESDPLGGPDILVLNGPTVEPQPYPSDVPPIGSVALEWLLGTGDLALTWNTGAGYVYALQNKTNLVDGLWEDDTTGIWGTGGDVTVTTTVDQAQSLFYRIILE